MSTPRIIDMDSWGEMWMIFEILSLRNTLVVFLDKCFLTSGDIYPFPPLYPLTLFFKETCLWWRTRPVWTNSPNVATYGGSWDSWQRPWCRTSRARWSQPESKSPSPSRADFDPLGSRTVPPSACLSKKYSSMLIVTVAFEWVWVIAASKCFDLGNPRKFVWIFHSLVHLIDTSSPFFMLSRAWLQLAFFPL